MKQIVTVGHTELNQYGDMSVSAKDENGNDINFKVAVKRKQLHSMFQQGQAVILDWQTFKDKDYVADASPVASELPPVKKPPTDSVPPRAEEVISGQERGMCLKEVGECIRSGQIEKDFPKSYTRIKTDYYKRVSKGSGISFWEQQGEE